jgi:hypothetical protein
MNRDPDQHPRPEAEADEPALEQDRREFLERCGRFAVVTPPAMAFLLSTTLSSNAIAKSGGGKHGNNGHHHGHHKPGRRG